MQRGCAPVRQYDINCGNKVRDHRVLPGLTVHSTWCVWYLVPTCIRTCSRRCWFLSKLLEHSIRTNCFPRGMGQLQIPSIIDLFIHQPRLLLSPLLVNWMISLFVRDLYWVFWHANIVSKDTDEHGGKSVDFFVQLDNFPENNCSYFKCVNQAKALQNKDYDDLWSKVGQQQKLLMHE